MAQRCSRGSKTRHLSVASLGATKKGQTNILSNRRKRAQRTSVKRLVCVMQVREELTSEPRAFEIHACSSASEVDGASCWTAWSILRKL